MSEPEVREHRLEFEGFRFVVRTVGSVCSGFEPVVILGGHAQGRRSWTRYEPVIVPAAMLVTMDLPGYGDSDPLPGEYGFEFLADAVDHAVAELGLGRINLVGVCFGAIVAMRLAQRRPERIARLALTATALEFPGDFTRAALRWRVMVDEGRLADVAGEMIGWFMAPDDGRVVRRRAFVIRVLTRQFSTRTQREQRMDRQHQARMMTHPPSVPGEVDGIPALVFTGEHDTLTTPEMGRAVAKRFAAVFATLTEADHLATLERDAEVADLVIRFFGDRSLVDLPYLGALELP